jgi:hypothetical protein
MVFTPDPLLQRSRLQTLKRLLAETPESNRGEGLLEGSPAPLASRPPILARLFSLFATMFHASI